MTGRDRACVAALLVERRRVLLCRRSHRAAWYPGVWDLPGGHVEPGETSRQALARECAEELGIAVVEVGDRWDVRVDAATLTVWHLTQWSGVPVNLAADEHDEVRWFGWSELANLQLADPRIEDLVRQVVGHAPDRA